MRYGLLALSIVMLTGGGVAAQSALTISHSASITLSARPGPQTGEAAIVYGALPFTAARSNTAPVTAS